MYTVFMIYETFTNGFISLSLYVFSLLSLLCGIMVIISKNPIISVLFLIGLFLSIACYLIILGLSFIGLSYLLVYVGAVSILFIFILMLINVRISELLSNTSKGIPLAILIPILFYNIVYEIIPEDSYFLTNTVKLNDSTNIYNKIKFFNFYYSNSKIAFITDKIWDGSLAETTHITSIGNIMYSSYSM